MTHRNRLKGEITLYSSEGDEIENIDLSHHFEYYYSMLRAMKISSAKNNDYAGGDDRDPLANFKMSKEIGVEPVKALWMRSLDKVSRINTYMRTGELAVENEGLDDAFLDLLNYCALALALLEDERNEM